MKELIKPEQVEKNLENLYSALCEKCGCDGSSGGQTCDRSRGWSDEETDDILF